MKEGYTDSLKEEEKKLQEELDTREIQEENILKSKSRNLLLKGRQKNSSFFFRVVIKHRQANIIVLLKKENGIEAEMHEEIEQVLTSHFEHLIEEPDLNRNTMMEEILEHIPSLITQE